MSLRTFLGGTAALALVVVGAVALSAARDSSGSSRPPAKASTAAVPPTSSQATTPSSSSSSSTTVAPPPVWRVAWGSPMAWGYGEVYDATVRDLVVAATAGQAVKFRISNVFGNAPLIIGAATVADSSGASTVDPATLHPLTFNGSATTSIPAGAVAYTDPVDLPVSAGQALAVSIWVSDSDLVTLHPCCTTYPPRDWFTPNGRGNATAAPTFATIGVASPFERFVDAMDVLQTGGRGSVVVLGDSITDGYNSTLRWTHVLQARVDQLPPSDRLAVVNEGITANALTSDVHTDALTGGGPPGVSRFQRDVLSQPGVSEVIVLLGTNDLWFGASAQDVIAGYQDLIAQAHAAGVRILGMTLLPRSTSRTEYWSPTDQQQLEAVDRWIDTSGAFDGVIHSAHALADIYNGQCNPTAMFPPFDSGDHLHPDPAGQTALANSVTAADLGLPSLPPAPPIVATAPTPGCGAPPA